MSTTIPKRGGTKAATEAAESFTGKWTTRMLREELQRRYPDTPYDRIYNAALTTVTKLQNEGRIKAWPAGRRDEGYLYEFKTVASVDANFLREEGPTDALT